MYTEMPAAPVRSPDPAVRYIGCAGGRARLAVVLVCVRPAAAGVVEAVSAFGVV